MSNSFQVHPGLSQRVGLLQIQGKGQASAAGFEYLSTEGLLVYCQSRLRDLDANIKGMMEAQKVAIAQRSEVARVTNELSAYSNQGPANDLQFDQAAASVRSLIETFPAGDPRRTELEQLAEKLIARKWPGGGQFNEANAGQWKGMQDTVKKMGEDITNGSEMAMLEIQSLMSQRQTAIQLVTGMLSKMNETTQSIAQKI